MTHYFVDSARGNGKCHDDIDDARQEIILDLIDGIKDAVKRGDMWDTAAISKLLVEACKLEAADRDIYHSEERLEFDSNHHWSIQQCHSYSCTDTVKRGSW